MNLKKLMIILSGIFVVVQLIILFNFDTTQFFPDAKSYVTLAKSAVEAGCAYPTPKDIYSSYLFAPGYVNFLALLFYMGFSVKEACFLNIIFNLGILWEVFYIGKKLANETVGFMAALFFAIAINTHASVLCLLTEVLYTSIAFLGFCLSLSDSVSYAFLSGVVLAIGNWVRPLGIVFIFAIIVVKYFMDKFEWKFVAHLIAGFALVFVLIGSITYVHCGYFAAQSSTCGVNLIMSANDFSRGNTSTGGKIFRKGEIGCLPQTLTFKERDLRWRELAIDWIKNNPGKYFGMIPEKILRLYAVNIGFLDSFSGKNGYIQNPKYFREMVSDFPHYNTLQWVVLYSQIYYLVILALFLYGSYYVVRNKDNNLIGLISVVLFGTLATLPFPCASRYHYPYMPVIFLLAAYVVYEKYLKVKVKNDLIVKENEIN